jgi:CRISPR/Cas system-associated exonuclease Cas4 (RecB family)
LRGHHLEEVIETIDAAIASGFLPAAPAKDACSFCDYRGVCGPREEERLKRCRLTGSSS